MLRQLPAAQQGRQALNALKLASPDLPGFREVETIYVLGCGPSVARVSDQQWNRIADGFSLGVNFFGLHPFLPKLLSQERTKNMDAELIRERRQARVRMLKALEPHRANILWKDGSHWSIDDAAPIIEQTPALNHRALQWLRIVVHGEGNLEKPIAASIIAHRRLHLLQRGFSLHLRSSVLYGALLGVALGVHRIVLVGVDLDSTEYFWDADPSLVREGLEPPPTAQDSVGRHSSEGGTLSTSAALRSLAIALKALGDAKLEVMNPSPVLAPLLPEYRLTS